MSKSSLEHHHSEWELLEIAEELEPGDFVAVENTDGSIDKCIYVKDTGKVLFLKNVTDKEIREFNTDSLEELGGPGCVTGRFDD